MSETRPSIGKGVRGWLLVLCIWTTIISPLFTFAKLHEMQNEAWYFCLGIVAYSIVSGVVLWLGRPVGVVLVRTLLGIILVYNLFGAFSLISQHRDSQVPAILIQSIVPVTWLIYLSMSKRVKATYESTDAVTGLQPTITENAIPSSDKGRVQTLPLGRVVVVGILACTLIITVWIAFHYLTTTTPPSGYNWDVGTSRGITAPTHSPPLEIPSAMRLWTAKDGRTMSAVAIKVDYDRRLVTFRRADNTVYDDFSISLLSDTDQILLLGSE